MESAKKLGVIQSKSEDVIRRGKTLDNGFYVSGKFEKVDVMFTIDTGASKTMILEEVYKKIPENTRPKLSQAASFRSADNSNIQEYGKAVSEVE